MRRPTCMCVSVCDCAWMCVWVRACVFICEWVRDWAREWLSVLLFHILGLYNTLLKLEIVGLLQWTLQEISWQPENPKSTDGLKESCIRWLSFKFALPIKKAIMLMGFNSNTQSDNQGSHQIDISTMIGFCSMSLHNRYIILFIRCSHCVFHLTHALLTIVLIQQVLSIYAVHAFRQNQFV